MIIPRFLTPLVLTIGFTACVTTHSPEEGAQHTAAAHLKEASQKTLSAEDRAARYLESAHQAIALMASPAYAEAGRQIYNQAVTDLTILLRETDGGRMWNKPQTLVSGATPTACDSLRKKPTASGIQIVSRPL